MAGKIHGLLGGVLLATSLIYYNSEDFKKSNSFVSTTLKQTEELIHNNNKQIEHQSLGNGPRSLEFQYRPSMKQTIADLWDEQVLDFARSVYAFDATKTASCLVNKLQNLINDVSK
ncbi:hypothetical protein WICPIJ_007486 [Wickerhamomyces pijperi]|uniref:MICOS complex subunit MIC12 n=1 Tax=Wickerhamomyces pijperi TaxID=599730 RepID=A0A9P8Q1N5_WICPI|nr:hypothetical protein WICPIJ_007486 [Wickerhamomyces pijperi]